MVPEHYLFRTKIVRFSKNCTKLAQIGYSLLTVNQTVAECIKIAQMYAKFVARLPILHAKCVERSLVKFVQSKSVLLTFPMDL